MKRQFKIFRIVFLLILYLGIQSLRIVLFRGALRERLGLIINSYTGKSLLKKLNVSYSWTQPPLALPKQCIVVANHLSWADPILLSTKLPAHFVTSQEVKSTIGIGWITRVAGCFFMSRSASSLRKELDMLAEALGWRKVLGFFPEATTGDGTTLLPFRNALLEIALKENIPVLPVCIQYTECNEEPIAFENRHIPYYFGNMTMLESLKNWSYINSLNVTLTPGALIEPQNFTSRGELGLHIRRWLEEQWNPIST